MNETLTIIQQNDVHSCINTHIEGFWHRGLINYRSVGGLARISEYVKTTRTKHENVLYIDNGDLLHGTAVSVLSDGEVLVPLLNQIGLDLFVPGNWDFTYGTSQLKSLSNQLNFPTIAGNVFLKENNSLFLTPYVIKELKGLKIGIIGMTYPYEEETMPSAFSNKVYFTSGFDEAPLYIEQLRQKERVDLIIMASHMGLPYDIEFAKRINGIDIILSGHTHDRLNRPIKINNTLIMQSGSSSSFIGRLDLTIDNRKIVNYSHQLIPLFAEEFKEDQTVEDVIHQLYRPFNGYLNQIVGKTRDPLHRLTLNDTPMDQLITDAYLHFTNADIAFSHGWRYGPPILPGNITMQHLYQIVPANPQLNMVEMDGFTLIDELERNLENVFSGHYQQQKGGYIIRSSGLMLVYKPNNPSHYRIEEIEVNGAPLILNKIYRIVRAGDQDFKNMSNTTFLEAHTISILQDYLSQIQEYKLDSPCKIICI